MRTLGLKTPIPGGATMQDLAMEMLDLARIGLNNRNNLSASGENETGYLSGLDEIARSGKTPAERLLERYHGAWNRDVRFVFAEEAY